MAIDLKFFAVCDHEIKLELVQIDKDLKTIRIPRVVSSNNVILYINGFLVNKDIGIHAYTIESDDLSVNPYKKKIVFKTKRKATDDFFEISYMVSSSLCPKCVGLKVLNDESYNNLGLIKTVQNEEKILQEVKKGLLTILGTNPFHSWWGTKISQMIGTKITNIDSIRAILIQEVLMFMDKYLDIQAQQSQYQVVTDRESLYQTSLVDVEPDQYDPTLWTITVIFKNRTGADMIFEKKFEVPSASFGNQTISA